MGKRRRMVFAALATAAWMMFAGATPAAAFTDGAELRETTGAAVEKKEKKKTAPLKEEKPDATETTPFSTPGNANLVDDAKDDETKQFLSVQTKNGNTFYIVVDRSGSAENVYLMSLVDEQDLAEFIGEESRKEGGIGFLKPDTKPVVATEPDSVSDEKDEKEEPSKGGGFGGMVLALLLFGACGAGIYYFKMARPRKDADGDEEAEVEEVEFSDTYDDQKEEPEIEE